MIHQPLVGGISGQATDILVEAKEMAYTARRWKRSWPTTRASRREITKDMERNYYMSAEEAKAYGIIDEVIVGSKLAALNGHAVGAEK